VVDDPYDWGRITAANALSDVYAMGGDPLTALQLIGWPRDSIPFEVLQRVIEGGVDVMADAGCVVVGGHSIDDQEPKYGFAVTGVIPPDEIMTNASARPGQVLVLTKAIGTGIIATAIKNAVVSAEVERNAVEIMAALNRGAALAARRIGVEAATDVTGFGLLGHLAEMVRASGVTAHIDVAAVPIIDGTLELLHAGMVPGGTKRNLKAVERMCNFGTLGEASKILLADAQTSGGLLLAVDQALEAALHQALSDEDTKSWTIGRIVERSFEHGPSGQIITS